MTVQVGKTGFLDMPLSRQMYDMAQNREDPITLTAFLEEQDPSEQYTGDEALRGTDAFQRQLMACGIRTNSDHQRGMYADRVGKFWDSKKENGAILFPEWVQRVWRGAASDVGNPVAHDTGKRFLMSTNPVSEVLYPEYISSIVRQRQIAPAIPLSAIIARVETCDSGAYISYRLTESSGDRTMRRVAEGTEVPLATLTGGDETIRMKTYGRAFDISYQAVRRMRIDKLAFWLALLSVQSEVDKVSTAIDVAINGDGNSGTSATNYDLNGDLGGTVSDPEVADYYAFRMKWASPYNCNVLLGTEAVIKQFLMMDAGTGNVMFGQLGGVFGGLGTARPLNPQLSELLVGWTSSVTADTWLGIDNRFTLEMIVEAGADITETDKLISQQFNRIVVTESLGFAVLDTYGAVTCTLNT